MREDSGKQTARGARRLFFFLILAALVLFAFSAWLRPSKTSALPPRKNAVDQLILSLPDQTMDVLFLGDSEAIANVSALSLWQEEGIASVSLGSVAQYLYQSREYLELALTYQKPKLVILEANNLYLKGKPENFVISACSTLFPVLRDHDRFKEYLPGFSLNQKEEEKKKAQQLLLFLGYNYSNDIHPVSWWDYMAEKDCEEPIGSWNRWEVKTLQGICKSHGIPFLLLSTPSLKNWTSAKHDAVEELAREMEVSYIDMNLMTEEIPIDWEKDTRDKGDHLAHNGMLKVSAWLGPYLKEEWGIPDHRGEEAYAFLEERLPYYQKVTGS